MIAIPNATRLPPRLDAVAVSQPWDAHVEVSAIAVRPPPPDNLVARPGANVGEIALSWSAPTNDGGAIITGYNIYRSGATSGWLFVAHVDGNTVSFTDTNLLPGVEYTFFVKAENGVGESEYSAWACSRAGPWIHLPGFIDGCTPVLS
jgi:hypothetical protein